MMITLKLQKKMHRKSLIGVYVMVVMRLRE
jgi:hypothetical protein